MAQTAETTDQAIVLARMLRTVDRFISDAKTIEKDRDELRKILAQSQKTGGTP